MRKIKKINGFLVVKFNDREKREYEGTALGEYGVIDAEVYTGNLDIDRGAMEYDDADTLEVAVELARGLESEEDITDEPPTYTAAVETNESYTEEAVEPAALIEGWTRRLATRVKSKHYPDTDPRTAAHELYGFKMALHQIGFLPESEVITDPDTFGAGRLDGPMPRNPEELLAFVCDERCKNRAGHTQEELDAICAKCPLGQLYEDAEAQDLRIRERSERALREHIEGVRHAEDTLTALLGGHEALAYLAALRDGQILQENEREHYAAQIAEAGASPGCGTCCGRWTNTPRAAASCSTASSTRQSASRRIGWRSSTSSGRRFSASARRTTARSTATCSAWRSTSTGRWAS